MANPQAEDGFTPIANEIVEALCRVNLSSYESRTLWYLFRKTYGWSKKTDWIALSQFSTDMGLDRRLVYRALHALSSKKMIVIYKDDTGHVSYGFQKDYEKWQVSSRKMTVINRDDKVSSRKMTRVSSKEIPTKETITKEKKERPPKLTDEEWFAYLSSNPAYEGINISVQKGKCEAWCITNRREFTRKTFINWLNRAEKPLNGSGQLPLDPIQAAKKRMGMSDEY